ncbi:amidohydrolase [Dactylosporangium roseum]|uniref:Amidohydrolase n=1 Tax=Dactylosporangium roseum TaxID=47989 RepID=A0ABY5Z0I6_9ACTN|nr:amidohydrolase [Dactylosporangium roseum]UWZ34575.1 amidohydrolase [Dactylosporangium roseum]
MSSDQHHKQYDDARTPVAVDVVLRSATVITMDDDDTCFDGDVAVDGGEIVAMGPRLAHVGREEVDLGGQVLLPGFVNAHTHECMERGWFEDLGFMEWLETYAQPKDRAYRPEHQRAASSLVQLELIKSGFTSILSMFRYPSVSAAVARTSGIRATFAPQLVEDPSGVGESWEDTLNFLDELDRDPHPRIRGWLGPHALYSCSEGTYREIARFARERRVGIHTHLAESRDEVTRIRERTGLTPTAYLDELIGLGPDVVLAHGVELTADDIARIADSGAAVAHCPTSNMKLGNNISPVVDLRAAGATVGLGTDSVMSNNVLDPFAEMRMACLVAKFRTGDPSVMSAPEVLRLATRGSARALGLEDLVGSVEVGKRADLVAVDLRGPHLWPLTGDEGHLGNLVEQLVYAARASDVSLTMVDGEILMSERRMRTLDEGAVREIVEAEAADLARRAGVDDHVVRRRPKSLRGRVQVSD